jgi:hypothetical protein
MATSSAEMADKNLLRGEHYTLSKNANVVIRYSDYGLPKISTGIDLALKLVGMEGKEAIGGRLHLTNYRLIFRSHAINRVTGTFSIFLPTIIEVKDTSTFLAKKMQITTQSQAFEFIVWGIPKLLAAIQSAKESITPELHTVIAAEAASSPEKCRSGLLGAIGPNILS